MVFNPALIIGAQRRQFVCGICLLDAIPRRQGRGLEEGRGRIVFGKRFSHRTGRLLELIEGRGHDAVLQLGIIGFAQGVAKGKGHKQRPSRFDPFGVFAHHGDGDGAEAGFFEHVGKHTNRVRTQRSRRGEKDHVNPFVFQAASHFRPRLFHNATRVAQGAHERVEVRSNTANHPACGQFPHAVDG